MKIQEHDRGVSQHDDPAEAVADEQDKVLLRQVFDSLDFNDVTSFIVMFKLRPGSVENEPEADCLSMRAGNMQELHDMSDMLSRDLRTERTRTLLMEALHDRNDANNHEE